MAGRRIISPKVRESDLAPISLCMQAGDFIFLSGQVARRPEDGSFITDSIENATRQCMENMKNLLEAAGATMDDLVKVTVYLKDFNDWKQMNEVYRTYFTDDPPTRTTIQAGYLGIGLVEIEGIAYVGDRKNR